MRTRPFTSEMTRRAFLGRSSLVVVGALSLPEIIAACSQAATGTSPSATLTIGTLPEFDSLDADHLSSTEDGVMSTIYDALIDMPQKPLEPRGWLAQSWDWTPDYTQLTLHLRQGVKFHDGSALTADAVAQNFTRGLNQQTGDSIPGTLGSVQSAAASGNDVVLTLKQPDVDVLYRLSWFRVMAPASFSTAKNNPIGTGPFKFVEWVPGDHLTVQRFDGYWKQTAGNVKQIVFKFFSDADALVNSAIGGQIDVLLFGNPKDADQLRSKGWTVYNRGVSDYMVLYLNATKSALQNLDLRQAVARAIDRDTIVKSAYYGLSTATTLPVPAQSPAYDQSIASDWNFDLSGAKQLVQSSGVSNPSFTVVIDSSFPDQVQAAQIIQQSLQQIGVTMTIKPVDSNTHTSLGLSGDYEALMWYASGGIADPADFEDNSGYRLPPRGVIWKNNAPADYVSSYTTALGTNDPAQRSSAFKAVWKVLHKYAWAIPIAWRAQLDAQKSTVTGVAYDVNDRLQPQDIVKS